MTEDAFEVLGIEPAFDIDRALVERRWLMHTARLHPDRAADPHDAARQLARVNAARHTLLDDEQRANALLRHHRGPSSEADNRLPDGFLIEIFELRQDIEETLASRDPEGIAAVEADATHRRHAFITTVAHLFANLTDPPTPDDLATIRRQLNAWRYIERLIEQLHSD